MAVRTAQRSRKMVGNYELLDKIADGGMGSVWKGRHRDGEEIVAVKVVTPGLLGNAVLLKRFEQEFRAARSLDHPNIVRGLDFGQEGESPYLVMEYVDGECLGDLVDKRGRMKAEEAVRIIGQVAQGLHHAHSQGIIHRDIKPDNILLTSDGQAKITDLGLIKEVTGGLNLTHTGRGLGTPHFMAPEQFRDAKSVDERSDIYSLAATLYVLVTGILPFDTPNPIDTFMKKVNNEYDPPRKLVPGLPARIDRAIRRGMSAAPKQRPASCPEFMNELLGTNQPESKVETNDTQPLSTFAMFGAERRAMVRFPSNQGGKCLAIGGDEKLRWTAKVHDISETGIALLLRRRFEPRTVLTVELKNGKQDLARRLLVRVVRVQPHSHRRWIVGCTFAKKLSPDEVQTLL